jgi:hypothetical protein
LIRHDCHFISLRRLFLYFAADFRQRQAAAASADFDVTMTCRFTPLFFAYVAAARQRMPRLFTLRADATRLCRYTRGADEARQKRCSAAVLCDTQALPQALSSGDAYRCRAASKSDKRDAALAHAAAVILRATTICCGAHVAA